MSAAVLLQRLRRAGVAIRVEGQNLRIRAPRGVLTPTLTAAITAEKDALIRLLAAACSQGTPSNAAISSSLPEGPTRVRSDADVIGLTARVSRSPFVAVCIEGGTSGLLDRPQYLHLAFADGSTAVLDLFLGRDLRRLTDMLRDTTIVTHDGVGSLVRLACHHGLQTPEIIDVYIAVKLLDGGQAQDERAFRLEAVVERELGFKLPNAPMDTPAALAPAAAHTEHARVLPQLWAGLAQQLINTGLTETAQLEFALVPVVRDMILAGVRVDKVQWDALVTAARHETHALTQRVVQELGIPNLDQPVILAALKRIGLPVDGTDKDTLAPYAHIPAVADLVELRRVDAFVRSTGPGLLRALKESPDGRVRVELRQLGTVTGRFTSPRLNLLGLPKSDEVRRAFIPAEGCVFVVGDYASCQLRIVAAYVMEEKLLEVFRRPDGDPHRLTAGLLLEKAEGDVTIPERERAKAVNFGFIFGMGVAAFIAYACARYGVTFTEEEATRFRAQFLEQYPAIAAWHARTKQPEWKGLASAGGRVRYFDDSDFCARLASPVQATEADGIKRAMVRLAPKLARLGARILLCIHDELLVEAPRAVAVQVRDLVGREMREAMQELVPEIPIRVDIGIRTSWAKADEAAPGTLGAVTASSPAFGGP